MGLRKIHDERFGPFSPELLKPEVLVITTEASGIVVKSQEDLTLADRFLKTVKAMRAKVAELCDPVVAAAHKAHKAATALRNSLDEPLEAAERSVKIKTGAYLTMLETARREEENRRMAEALAAAKIKQEQEAMLFAALDEPAAAAEVMAAPVIAEPIAPVAKVEMPAKMQFVSTWSARVIDESKVPREFLVVDYAKLNALAKAMRDGFKVDGCESYEDKSVRISN